MGDGGNDGDMGYENRKLENGVSVRGRERGFLKSKSFDLFCFCFFCGDRVIFPPPPRVCV